MLGYYISVPGMTVPQLTEFVRKNMLTVPELRKRANIKGVPQKCHDHVHQESSVNGLGVLQEFCDQYRTVPSEDLTIRIVEIDGVANVQQFASGGGTCRQMKGALRKIVVRHLAEKLRAQGYRYNRITV